MAKKRFTVFGRKVRRAMEKREIYQWTELHRALLDVDYDVSRQQMMNYVYGDNVADEEFMRCISLALNLTEEERQDIVYAWAYQQNRIDEVMPKTPIHKVAVRLGWTEEEKQRRAYQYVFKSSALAVTA